MTKVRAPLTFGNALGKISGVIGYPEMAKLADRQTRTVLNWSDPDTDEHCPIDFALKFDVAFQAAGGDGAPMFETYALQLEQARAERFSDQAELARRTMQVVKEASEAEVALIAATLPGATDKDRKNALREAEEAIAALKRTLPLLTNGNGVNGNRGEGMSPGGDE